MKASYLHKSCVKKLEENNEIYKPCSGLYVDCGFVPLKESKLLNAQKKENMNILKFKQCTE